jgi:hypothetical protein
MIRLAILLALLIAAPAAAQPPAANDDLSKDFDKFWEEEEFKDDYLDGTGTGGGPAMVWREQDLDAANRALVDAGLITLPEKTLSWGGAGWFSMHTGDKLFIALGGGGYGGAGESQRGEDFSRFSRGAGYLSVKGVLPLHKRLFLEAGIALGGGISEVTVERTETGTGIIQVYLRGEQRFLLLRPHLGLDLRLARWAGVLVEGGYELTSGDWTLEGDAGLVRELELGDGSGPYLAVTLRFGI